VGGDATPMAKAVTGHRTPKGTVPILAPTLSVLTVKEWFNSAFLQR
jgi:hypothetical protein